MGKGYLSYYYSLLKAATGSFFAAFLAGISPAVTVIAILKIIRITAELTGNDALTSTSPVSLPITELTGIVNNIDTTIPSTPDNNPMRKVSALNTCEILAFEAPMALNMPITFVLSITEICVIIPMEPANAVSMVLPFFALRLLKLRDNDVPNDILALFSDLLIILQFHIHFLQLHPTDFSVSTNTQ